MYTELVGDADHRQRLHELRALLEEFLLGLDDDADDAEERVAALFNGLNEPAGVADVVGDVFTGFAVDFLFVFGHAFVDFIDVEARGMFIGEAHGVLAGVFVALHNGVRRDGGDAGLAQEAAGAGVEVAEEVLALVNLFDGEAGFTGNLGETVHLQVMQVLAHQRAGDGEVKVLVAAPRHRSGAGGIPARCARRCRRVRGGSA